MPADSSSSNNNPPLSPPVTTTAAAAASAVDGGVNSPQSRRSLTSPWAQVVRGGAETTTAVTAPRSPSSSPEKVDKISPENDGSDTTQQQPESSTDARPKKPAWKKPLNGVVVEAGGSVMGGAVAWPALSESLNAPKSFSDSSKPITDGSASVSQGPIISQLPQKHGNTNANNSHSNANHTMPARQRSMKHRGGSGSSSGPGGGTNQSNRAPPPPPPPPPLPPQFPVIPFGSIVPPPVMEPRVRGPRPVGGVPSQPGDQFSHRGPHRKGNFGGRPRGDGSYQNNHGGRRDQDRRDVHVTTPQFVPAPGGFTPPQSPGSAPFMPPPLRPFAGPLGYDMPPQFIYVPAPLPPDSFRGVPIIPPPPPPPFFFPLVDPNLPPMLVKQIEYYFSDDNLVKDDFLRSNMDEEGWVPIELIANFPRVMRFTNNIQFILDCLRASTLVELQADKVRRRDDWKKWIHTPGHLAADSGSQTPGALTGNVLTSSFQKVSLDESGNDKSNDVDPQDVQVEVAVSSIPEELTSQSKLVKEGNAEETCSGDTGK